MKKVLNLAMIVLLIFAFVGCSKAVPDVTVKEIISNIGNEVEKVSGLMETDLTNGEMVEANKDMINAYHINLEDIEQGIIKAPMINLVVDEVVVIKVKDESKIPAIKEGLQNHVENQLTAFENYVPENYEIVKNHILKSKGKYILLAISEDAEKIEDIFDKALE